MLLRHTLAVPPPCTAITKASPIPHRNAAHPYSRWRRAVALPAATNRNRPAGPQPPPAPSEGGAARPPSVQDDIDDIILNEEYYSEFGMTRDDALRQQLLANIEEDPDAMPADAAAAQAAAIGSRREAAGRISNGHNDDLGADLRQQIEDLEPYGPEVGAGCRLCKVVLYGLHNWCHCLCQSCCQ